MRFFVTACVFLFKEDNEAEQEFLRGRFFLWEVGGIRLCGGHLLSQWDCLMMSDSLLMRYGAALWSLASRADCNILALLTSFVFFRTIIIFW